MSPPQPSRLAAVQAEVAVAASALSVEELRDELGIDDELREWCRRRRPGQWLDRDAINLTKARLLDVGFGELYEIYRPLVDRQLGRRAIAALFSARTREDLDVLWCVICDTGAGDPIEWPALIEALEPAPPIG